MGLKLAFLGTGAMGGAILHGVLNSDIQIDRIVCTTASSSSAKKLRESIAPLSQADRVTVIAGEEQVEANSLAAKDADIVLLGVKPFAIGQLTQEIAEELSEDAVVVSLAAGQTIHAISSGLKPNQPVIRSMPNTPAQIGLGITGITHNAAVSTTRLDQVIQVFSTGGKVLVLDEEKIDALGAISGSGPAYVYFILERFTEAAKNLNFSAEDASLLVEGTFSGALALLEHSKSTPTALRKQVTSPQGTTEQAIAVFQKSDLDEIIADALNAAIRRSRELSGK